MARGRSTDGFARRVRDARCAAGLSQRALAELSGVARSTIAAIELGWHKEVKIETLRRLAEAMDIDIYRLAVGGGAETNQRACVERFLGSFWAQSPTEDEVNWLLNLPSISWRGRSPTEVTCALLIAALRSTRE
jgi:transcriptional regulator with XRE-family HTH domain